MDRGYSRGMGGSGIDPGDESSLIQFRHV